jgi:cycloeucalenol cycloisomerase
MIGIFAAILVGLFGISQFLQVKGTGNWLPSKNNLAKRQFEIYALAYSVVWIFLFGIVVAFQLWRSFTAWHYMFLCVGLALPFLLQPLLFPFSAEKCLPLYCRYSLKANVWLAIFSFIGSYWYTHYFYSVLGAKYNMPAHRLNDVPIALYFAAHFYFVLYHTLSNMLLRKIETRYAPGTVRTLFFWSAILAFSYFTAFMETLTISNYEDYSFEDRDMAYKVGSLFYGLYFIVSYPVFYRLDEEAPNTRPHSLYQTVLESFGASMMVLCLLDFGRLFSGRALQIQGEKWLYLYNKQ